MQPATRPAISVSVSGVRTTNGYSTRQSVASVTCETRDMPSNLMLSLAVTRERTRTVRLRRSQTARNCAANASTALRDSASSSPTTASRAGIGRRRAALLDLAETVVQRLDQLGAPARVVEQVVLQVGVALDDPDVAEHLVQHARRAAGAALAAQEAEHLPGARAEQADDDLAVGERGVVVGNLAQARRRAGCFCFGADPVDRQRGVHGGTAQFAAAVRGAKASYRSAAKRPRCMRSRAPRRGGYSRLPARSPGAG